MVPTGMPASTLPRGKKATHQTRKMHQTSPKRFPEMEDDLVRLNRAFQGACYSGGSRWFESWKASSLLCHLLRNLLHPTLAQSLLPSRGSKTQMYFRVSANSSAERNQDTRAVARQAELTGRSSARSADGDDRTIRRRRPPTSGDNQHPLPPTKIHRNDSC